MHDIASGKAGLPLATVIKYRVVWLEKGYELPLLEHPDSPTPTPELGIRGLGDLLAKGLHFVGIRKKKDCGCHARQEKLNALIPNPFSKKQDDLLPTGRGQEETGL